MNSLDMHPNSQYKYILKIFESSTISINISYFYIDHCCKYETYLIDEFFYINWEEKILLNYHSIYVNFVGNKLTKLRKVERC